MASPRVLPLLALFLVGCGEGVKNIPKLGNVTGVVKLDGAPLPKAQVQFIPAASRPSTAITDAEGKYLLDFNGTLKGAAIGAHQVRITSSTDAAVKEKLPPIYHAQTQLKADVKEGDNKIDFDLKSK